MTQDQLAQRLFVSRQTVSNYETGKSNPDIDMLVHIAEVFETDVNRLIYGPPVQQDRKRAWIVLAALAAVTLILGVFTAWFTPFAKAHTQETFDASLSYLNAFLVQPVFCILLGRTAMEAAGVLFRAERPKGRWLRWGRLLFAGWIVIYFVLMAPYLVDMVQIFWEQRRLRALGGDWSFSYTYQFLPVWETLTNRLVLFRVDHWGIFLTLFLLSGAGLWVTKRTKQNIPAESKPDETDETEKTA